MNQAATTTLFEQLGGSPAIKTVVGAFYDRVLADNDLKGFFSGVNMDVQQQQQVKFLTMALGGPNEYKGKSMKDAHSTMGITEHHFGLVAGHLVDTLKGAGVPADMIEQVVGLVGPLQADIVTA